MESVDQQFRELKEQYERMTEGELDALAEKAYELTEIAREALQAVIKEKVIAVRLALEPPPTLLRADLVILGWPESFAEVQHTKKVLDAAGIPSFICVEVKPDDLKRALAIMQRDRDEEIEKENSGGKKEFAILCPKCHSAEVVLEEMDAQPVGDPPIASKFQWICDACGHQWEDGRVGAGSCWRPVLAGRRIFFSRRDFPRGRAEITRKITGSR